MTDALDSELHAVIDELSELAIAKARAFIEAHPGLALPPPEALASAMLGQAAYEFLVAAFGVKEGMRRFRAMPRYIEQVRPKEKA